MAYSDKSIQYLKELREKTDLNWEEIADEWNKTYGDIEERKTPNALRKLYARYRTDELTDDTLIKNLTNSRNTQKKNLKLSREVKLLSEEHYNAEKFLQELERILKKAPIKLHKKIDLPKPGKISRTLVAHISDTHIGCNIEKLELGDINQYNPRIAARRFAYLFKMLAEYKRDHRDETELLLVLNGDIFAGVIHDTETVDVMSKQFANGLRIFSQGISYLAQHFQKIRILGVTGNHDRYVHKENRGRQTSQKWDSFATNLYVALRERFIDYESVEFEIPETPYALFDVQGHKFFATHGDTVLNIGNPGKKIDVEGITKQVNNFIAGLGVKFHVLMAGHVHKEMFLTLDNGVEVAINGTLSGTDSFAQGIGILSNHPCQQIFEVTPEHKIGDMRFVRLKNADRNKSLEKVIEPLLGNF